MALSDPSIGGEDAACLTRAQPTSSTRYPDFVVPFATGRNLGKCKNTALKWPEFLKKFHSRAGPPRPTSSFSSWRRPSRNELKKTDGWWIGGSDRDGGRARTSISERQVITSILEGEDFTPAMLDDLTSGSAASATSSGRSTRPGSTQTTPAGAPDRALRRPVTQEEYVAVSRLFAAVLDRR
jgi:hypothetical protein